MPKNRDKADVPVCPRGADSTERKDNGEVVKTLQAVIEILNKHSIHVQGGETMLEAEALTTIRQWLLREINATA